MVMISLLLHEPARAITCMYTDICITDKLGMLKKKRSFWQMVPKFVLLWEDGGFWEYRY